MFHRMLCALSLCWRDPMRAKVIQNQRREELETGRDMARATAKAC